MRSAVLRFAALVVLAGLPATGFCQYKKIAEWKVGGSGFWDYMAADPGAGLVYASHGPRVEVLDVTTGKLVGAITGLKVSHGIALDSDGKVGYVSDSGLNQVVIFDRKTFATLGAVDVQPGADAIVFEPKTRTVWCFLGRSKAVAVIDAGTRKVLATVALPGRPEFAGVDGKGNVFDAIEDKNEIAKLDAASRTVTAVWPVTNCDGPGGLAVDAKGNRIFSTCDGGHMVVVDAASGKQIATIAIGNGPDAAVFSATRNLAFSPNGQDGTITVVDAANGYKVLQTVETVKGARTMAYDESLDRLYLSVADLGPRPAATADNPHPRPAIIPDTFRIVVVGR